MAITGVNRIDRSLSSRYFGISIFFLLLNYPDRCNVKMFGLPSASYPLDYAQVTVETNKLLSIGLAKRCTDYVISVYCELTQFFSFSIFTPTGRKTNLRNRNISHVQSFFAHSFFGFFFCSSNEIFLVFFVVFLGYSHVELF